MKIEVIFHWDERNFDTWDIEVESLDQAVEMAIDEWLSEGGDGDPLFEFYAVDENGCRGELLRSGDSDDIQCAA